MIASSSRAFLRSLCFALAFSAIALPIRPAHAVKNSTIVLRAAGSGAVVGLAAGALSYPIAKSTGVFVAGAVVGAALGAVYGYWMVGQRDERYRSITEARPTALEEIQHANAARIENTFRAGPVRAEFVLPVAFQF